MSTSKEVTRRPAGALAVEDGQLEWKDVQVAALKQLGLDDAPPADLAVFLHQAQRTGLDPFAKQIYMIGRKDGGRMKYTIQAAIDGLRIVAERHGQYGGQEGPEWCGEDGVWRDVWVSKAPPLAARVGIIRRDWDKPIWATAVFDEFAGKTGNWVDGEKIGDRLNAMWATKSSHMIAKCAEALALRKAFPQDLSGIYIEEEMHGEPVAVSSERVAGPAAPAREEIDWDSKLAEATGDVAALKALYRLAKGTDPKNLALAERIAAAGTAAADAAAAAAAPPDDVVDAEVVVDEPSPETPTEPAPDAPGEAMASEKQLQGIAIQFGEAGVHDREVRLAVISLMLNDRFTSMKQMTFENAVYVSNRIKTMTRAGTFDDTVARALVAVEPDAPEAPVSE